jgi:hypothetical protein
MKKVGLLLKKCSQYMMVCEASIRSDLAKRIMHSVLPHVADPAQVASTKGVVDYKSLAAAAEGRHDIIKYGTKACIGELQHFISETNPNESDPRPSLEAMDYFNIGDYSNAISICVNCFGDPHRWEVNYGGKAWEKIARTIQNLIELDKQLIKLKKNRFDPNFTDNEVEILNNIVIYLNVFDGLVHNTGSIMGKVVREEVKDFNLKENLVDPQVEEAAVTRLMHSKELDNPVHVYKEVENILKGTGDINRWKDYNWKLKNHPDYQGDNNDRSVKIAKISLHKACKETLHEAKALFETFLTKYQSITNDINGDRTRQELAKLMPPISTKMREMKWAINDIINPYSYSTEENDQYIHKALNNDRNTMVHCVERAAKAQEKYFFFPTEYTSFEYLREFVSLIDTAIKAIERLTTP